MPFSWAYGGTYEQLGSGPTTNGSVSYRNFAESAVVLTETNGSTGVAQVEIQRAVVSLAYLSACWGSCAQPRATMVAQSKGVEYEVTFANLTDAGSVTTPNGAVAAVALLNESTLVWGNFSENYRWTQSSGGPSGTERFNLTEQVSGGLNATWANPLGMVPHRLASGMSWSSSALARLSGTTAHRVVLGYQGPLVAPTSSVDNVTSLAPNPVSMNLTGSSSQSTTLPNGVLAQPASLYLTGPGTLQLDGLTIAPSDAFQRAGFSSQCGHGQMACAGTESTPAVDLVNGASGAAGFVGSTTAVGAFAHFFSPNSTADTPQGQAFPVGVPPLARPGVAVSTLAAPSRPLLVDLPESVGSAVAVIQTFVPHTTTTRVLPGGTGGTHLPPILHSGRLPGLPVVGGFPVANSAQAFDLTTALTMLFLVVGLSVLGLAAARRGPPRDSSAPLSDGDLGATTARTSRGSSGGPTPGEPEDPIGYLW